MRCATWPTIDASALLGGAALSGLKLKTLYGGEGMPQGTFFEERRWDIERETSNVSKFLSLTFHV